MEDASWKWLSCQEHVDLGWSMKIWSTVPLLKVLVAELFPTLCDLMDCSPSGSSVHRILQPRILEWVAIPFSRESS